MADKEERILIARSTDYTLTDTDKGELFEGKIAPHCANVITRREAIEKIALVICMAHSEPICGEAIMCENCEGKKVYIPTAEAALNALLEGVKK